MRPLFYLVFGETQSYSLTLRVFVNAAEAMKLLLLIRSCIAARSISMCSSLV